MPIGFGSNHAETKENARSDSISSNPTVRGATAPPHAIPIDAQDPVLEIGRRTAPRPTGRTKQLRTGDRYTADARLVDPRSDQPHDRAAGDMNVRANP